MRASSNLGNALPAPDDLHAGNVRTMPVSVAAGTYVRGQVLGRTSNVYGALGADGTTARAIVVEDVVLGSQTDIPVYIAGDFNQDALTYAGAGATLAAVKSGLRDVGIMVRKWGEAPL